MSFKDVLADDITNVFMNVDELAETHTIDDTEYTCMFDDAKLSKNDVDGIYDVTCKLFISKDVLGYQPVPKQRLNIDDTYYYVMKCVGNDLYEVTLRTADSI